MHRPILIMTFPRSGSSMTAGIFARHGIWTGTCSRIDKRNAKGYFENDLIKEAMKEWFGNLVRDNKVAEPKPEWKDYVLDLLEVDGYSSGPWLIKTSPLYYKVWQEFDPYWVNVRRPKNCIIQSCLRINMVTRDRKRLSECIDTHNDLMDQRGVDVITSDVVKGDYRSLERAFEYCGLEFDPERTKSFVDGDLWNYR